MSNNKFEIRKEDKLKILCLHGYRQNATAFKSKLGSFRKLSNKYAELTFLDGIHEAPALPDQEKDRTYLLESWSVSIDVLICVPF